MARGPMAKHPSARARTNTHSTAREIVLRHPDDELLPVPPLPERGERDRETGELIPSEWHPQVKLTWVQLWQYPLVYEAPEVDQHLLHVYAALLQSFWERSEAGKPINEVARDLRAYAELWGIGEKARRHLQITIQQAEEALDRGRRMNAKRIDAQVEELTPTAGAYTPEWGDDDEDDGTIIADAEVVE